MNELQADQSYGLSYDENLFLSYQKINVSVSLYDYN